MTPLATQEIPPDIYAVNNDYVNFYLMRGADKYVAFDAGADASLTKIALEDLNINADDVIAIFLTHTDTDHTAAINLFPNAGVYIAKEEEQMIDGTTTRSLIFNNKLDCGYKTLGDGEALNIAGIDIKCILTPGHTNGSMCYIAGEKYLFVGDTMSIQNGKAELFNHFYNMDDDVQTESLKKLSGLTGIKIVFTAHYGYLDNYEAVFEKWRD